LRLFIPQNGRLQRVVHDRSDGEHHGPVNAPYLSYDIGRRLCAAQLPAGAVCSSVVDGQEQPLMPDFFPAPGQEGI
jgi:hypothetical protein